MNEYWAEDAIRIKVRRADWTPAIEILIVRGADTYLKTDGTFGKIDEYGIIPRSSSVLMLEEAQRLMDMSFTLRVYVPAKLWAVPEQWLLFKNT